MFHDRDLTTEIQALLSDKLLADVPSPEANLLETGVVDSITLIQLLVQLEEHFGIQLALEELEIDDFSSIRSLARLVANQTMRRGTMDESALEQDATRVGASG